MNKSIRSTVIRIKLREMTESIELIQTNFPDSADSFQQLGLIKDGIYKRTEYAIENVFDICAILNTDLQLGVPGGADEDILEHLVQHGVFGSGMRQTLKTMKGFRNIVVHRYGAIDDTLAFSILQEHIGDFSVFQQEIERFLQSTENK
ncbi:DUF86 domain-containing protein [Methanogenium cariaci]|uniref:type VII toxin-antitoxin system HepT family RNase toxin n=1 Tax=Methanogenium cariaci TaxID=2197 RepID=UPI0007863F0F|nr:DUF86 domain-containing protein [Methanogenium cariaci]